MLATPLLVILFLDASLPQFLAMMEIVALLTLVTMDWDANTPTSIAQQLTLHLQHTNQTQELSAVSPSLVTQKLDVSLPTRLAMMEINALLILAIQPTDNALILQSLANKPPPTSATATSAIQLTDASKIRPFSAMMEILAPLILATQALELALSFLLFVHLLQTLAPFPFVMLMLNNVS
jgi:hypothetical protein